MPLPFIKANYEEEANNGYEKMDIELDTEERKPSDMKTDAEMALETDTSSPKPETSTETETETDTDTDSEREMRGKRKWKSYHNKNATKATKYLSFISDEIGLKEVSRLPGVGKKRAQGLKRHGYDKASAVLVKFIELKKNKESFQMWMKEVCGASAKHSSECYASLHDWSERFVK